MRVELTYRLFEERDLPGLLRLWEEDAGWGVITAEKWRQWFLETPQGPCLVPVALDGSGQVAGQGVFMPSRLEVDGRQVRALRASAPILRQGMRRGSVRERAHPVVNLLLTAREAAIAAGFDLIYGLPEHAWLPFFRWMSRAGLPQFDEAEYECMALNLAAAPFESVLSGREPDDLEARPADAFGQEYEGLWVAARDSFPIACGVVRDADWVRFRNGGRIALEVRRRADGDLAGYVSFKRQGNLLADLLARCPCDLARVLAAGINHLALSSNGLGGEVKAMATPALRPVLESLGFKPSGYKFAFICNSLRDTLPREAISPERWYIMPGD